MYRVGPLLCLSSTFVMTVESCLVNSYYLKQNSNKNPNLSLPFTSPYSLNTLKWEETFVPLPILFPCLFLTNSSFCCWVYLKGGVFCEELYPLPCPRQLLVSSLCCPWTLYVSLSQHIAHYFCYLFHICHCLTANCEFQETSLIYLVSPMPRTLQAT